MSYCVLISFKLCVFVAFMLFFWITLKSSYIPSCAESWKKSAKLTLLRRQIYLYWGLRANGGPCNANSGSGELLATRTSGSAPLWDSAGCYDTAEEAARRAFTQQIDGFTAQKVWQSHSTVPEKSRGAGPKYFYVWFKWNFCICLSFFHELLFFCFF